MINIVELRELDKRMVKAPWMVEKGGKDRDGFRMPDYPQRIVANNDGLSLVAETYTDPGHESDAEQIAAMRNSFGELVEENARLRRENQVAIALLNSHADGIASMLSALQGDT